MLLKIGELARRTGLTVRTLHHYDAMGLLKPSARSEAGYRLYNRDDIARLHAIQALRQIGIPLAQISALLTSSGDLLPAIIQRQMIALERQIGQANELRIHLQLLQDKLAEGIEPDMGNWLSVLASMSTYGKYFTAAELKIILGNWERTKVLWPPLVAQVREAMTNNISPESPEIQPLARRWMDLMHMWMGGDFDLLARWLKMYAQEPAAQNKNGVDLAMTQYIGRAIELRSAALMKYFTPEQLQRLNVALEPEWQALADRVRALLQAQVPAGHPQAQAAVQAWGALIHRTADHDPVIREKLITAHRSEPILQAGSILRPDVLNYLRNAVQASSQLAPPRPQAVG